MHGLAMAAWTVLMSLSNNQERAIPLRATSWKTKTQADFDYTWRTKIFNETNTPFTP